MDLSTAASKNVMECDIVTNDRDLRRDLHIFVRYVGEYDVKRTHRTNELPKADLKRLARRIGDSVTVEEIVTNMSSPWIEFIDELALRLGFVGYDTQGKYMGYTSSEPSFPDNYIEVNRDTYERFLERSPMEQEEAILKVILGQYDYSKNELFNNPGPLAILDGFNIRGCATAVVPLIRFDVARGHLLHLMKECRSGVWYSTASFVQDLKMNHTDFLIPRKIKVKERWWNGNIYGNFKESNTRYGSGEEIPSTASNSFERVEGRFVERFLEGLPLTMRYVDVAYKPLEETDMEKGKETVKEVGMEKVKETVFPSIRRLIAFRVNDRFLRVMNRKIGNPRVIVQPNFEVHVEADLYPVGVITKLLRIANIVTEDVSVVMKLDRKKVASLLTEEPGFDVIRFLMEMTGEELPQNISTELGEWVTHAEKFILYDGFGLLECDEKLKLPDGFFQSSITPSIMIMRSPDTLFSRLEESQLVPIMVKHHMGSLAPIPSGARSVFLKKGHPVDAGVESPKERKPVILAREVQVSLHFPSSTILKKFAREFKKAGCPVEVNESSNTILYGIDREQEVKKVMEAMSSVYRITIEGQE